MSDLAYMRATDIDQAISTVSGRLSAGYLAGGTTQVDLLLKDRVVDLDLLVDITRLPLSGIDHGSAAIRVGALTTMEELAADPIVAERLPFVREALLLGASAQLRNMATIGGNLLQRTRCRYFRDRTVPNCNKRAPGSGCAAWDGFSRMHAILGVSEHCIALHASDLAVALIALDTTVNVIGPDGERSIALTDFYREPGDTPNVENVLRHGDLITSIDIPLLPRDARSHYLKVRDRTSYEFALASAGVAVTVANGSIVDARVGLGGVGTIPWRARAAERVLIGASPGHAIFEAAADAEFAAAITREHNAFKVELAKRTMVRTLCTVTGVE